MRRARARRSWYGVLKQEPKNKPTLKLPRERTAETGGWNKKAAGERIEQGKRTEENKINCWRI
jgi:hypothetical protein